METLAKRIRHARRAKGLSQDAVAKHFGIQRVSVTQWENDQTKPATAKLSELASLLGVSEEWLISNRGDPPKPPKRHHSNKLDELLEGFPALAPQDQDRVLDLMRRLASPKLPE